MPAEREKQEFEILSILEEAGEPLGSGQLSLLLNENGLEVSEATVGRILSEMDRKHLTIKLGFQGRVISAGGREKLQEYRSARHRQKIWRPLYRNAENKEEGRFD
jgi:Uncharacterized protein conserved in archaea